MINYYVRLKSGGWRIAEYKNLAIAKATENMATNYNIEHIRAAKQIEIDLFKKEKERTIL